jgi:hypothetical protein
LPFSYYATKFSRERSIAYLLAQHASRDDLMGRDVLAEQGRSLAQRVFNGEWPMSVLQKHPSYPVFHTLFDGTPRAEE